MLFEKISWILNISPVVQCSIGKCFAKVKIWLILGPHFEKRHIIGLHISKVQLYLLSYWVHLTLGA